MTETIDSTPVDRTSWDAGPWDDEPDRIEWEHAGRPCLMVRHESLGHWCGYAAVDPGHPLHGKNYDDAIPWDDDAEYTGPHGGLTYASLCAHNVCHVPKPGQPDEVWWFGFDCAHSFDHSPGRTAWRRDFHARHPEYAHLDDNEVYRDVPYVRAETNRLAAFLAESPA